MSDTDQIEAATLQAQHRETLRAQNVAIVEAQTGAAQAPKLERVARTHTFQIRHETGDGTVLQGQFTTQILTIQKQIAVGVLRGQLTGGAAYQALDFATINLSEMVAHLSICLTEKPPWAVDLLGMDDTEVIAKIYEEVDKHARRFRGASTAA